MAFRAGWMSWGEAENFRDFEGWKEVSIQVEEWPGDTKRGRMSPKEIEGFVRESVALLRERGLRRTRALELVLEEMARRDKPVTLAELTASPQVKVQCDPATVYRLVIKLEEQGLVRRLGLHGRSAYFLLVVPGRHHDYLVCTQCGRIEEIDMACPVHELEKDLEKQSGYQRIYHELEFFGVCPSCAA